MKKHSPQFLALVANAKKHIHEITPQQLKEKLEHVSKVAAADEGQGASGAQRRSVLKVLDGASTGATQPVAAAVDCEKRFLEKGIIRGKTCGI